MFVVFKFARNFISLSVQSWGIPKGILSGNPFCLSAIAALTQWPGKCRLTHHIKCMFVWMPHSTLIINIDKTYSLSLFMGLLNGEFNPTTYRYGGPVRLYRTSFSKRKLLFPIQCEKCEKVPLTIMFHAIFVTRVLTSKLVWRSIFEKFIAHFMFHALFVTRVLTSKLVWRSIV